MSSHQSFFPAAEVNSWRALVTKLLKGASPESLTRCDEDGLAVPAFYDITTTDHSGGSVVPMGPTADKRLAHGWDIAQPVIAVYAGDRQSILAANQVILDAVNSGASSLVLFIDDASADHFDLLFDQIAMSAIAIQICGGNDTASVMQKFSAFAGDRLADIQINAGVNPLRDGDDALNAGFALCDAHMAPNGAFNFDGWDLHNRGHSAAAEIGIVLAGLAALLGHMADRDPAQIISSSIVTLALPADSFLGIAKIRALRIGWAGLCDAFGLDHYPLFITGITSLRMASVLDQDTNILRNSSALLGGAIGGVDRMAGFAHDALGAETEDGRRLTRMTQLMMIEESGLAHTLDPAAGAPFFEQRSDDLAVAGWTIMQQIWVAGGINQALQSGVIGQLADAAIAKRNAALSSGQDQLVGVTLQPTNDAPVTTGPLYDLLTGLRRPAEMVEALRRAQSNKRILIVRARESDPAEERAIRKWLAIAGLTAVTLPDDNGDDIATAAPDVVIMGTNVQSNVLAAPAQIIAAADILRSDDQLGILADMIGRHS